MANDVNTSFPLFTATAGGPAGGTMQFPEFKADANATRHWAILNASPFSFTSSATTGATASGSFGVSASATASGETLIRLDTTLAEFSLDATAVSGGLASANMRLDMSVTLESFTAARSGSMTIPFSLTAEGTAGAVGRLEETIQFVGSGSIISEVTITADMQFPEFTMGGAVLVETFPEFTSEATGYEVITRNLKTYVAHLDAKAEITEYIGYDFENIIYFKGEYYGVKGNSLYLLGGIDDVGAQIAVDVKTREFDFNESYKKRIPYLYTGSEYDFDVTPYIDGVAMGTYRSTKGDERVYLPKGLTSRYWQLQYQNIDGNHFELDSVGVIVNVLRRKV